MKFDMTALCEDVLIALTHNCDALDPIQLTCTELADAYGLWEDGNEMPLWLSHLVQGIANDRLPKP